MTKTTANFAHAEGKNTIASGRAQHAQGAFNIEDTSAADGIGNRNLLHIVGNGTSEENRSNAHTLDWQGNAWFSGDVYVGSTGGKNKDEGSKRLITEDDVKNRYIAAGQIAGTPIGTKATAEGADVNASGSYSHAEGYQTSALASHSHAEGALTIANANASHAEGESTKANGFCSHSEGMNTIASGRA
jgi:hypothetical protein